MSVVELRSDIPTPAHFWMPEHVSTDGLEVIDFADAYGYTLDSAQMLAIDMIFAEKKVEGRLEPAAFEAAILACRQNMKTYVLEVANLADVFLFGNEAVWTAHLARTTGKTMTRILEVIESNPDLDRQVKKVSQENGAEFIQTRDNGLLEFMARTAKGGRGFAGNKLTLDEALYVTPAQTGALYPILLARAHSQVRIASSAPLAESKVLRSVRDRGRVSALDPDHGDQSLAFIEYGDVAPPSCALGESCTHRLGMPGCCVDDEERWARANAPALAAGRTSLTLLRSLRRSAMPVEEFTREIMGWGEEPLGEAAIDEVTWTGLKDPGSTISTTPHFGLNVSPDRKWGCLAVAGQSPVGRAHVEITGRGEQLDYRPGTTWILDRLDKIHEVYPEMVLTVLAGAATDALLLAIRNLGITVEPLDSAAFAAACGLVYDAAATKDLVHIGQADLDKSINATRWRDSGVNTQVWGRRHSEGDITPTFAITLALASAHRAGFADYDPLDSVY